MYSCVIQGILDKDPIALQTKEKKHQTAYPANYVCRAAVSQLLRHWRLCNGPGLGHVLRAKDGEGEKGGTRLDIGE